MDDLERRMARRREAREQQLKLGRCGGGGGGGIGRQKSPLPAAVPGSVTKRKKKVTLRAPYATDDFDPPASVASYDDGDGGKDEDLDADGDVVKGPSPNRQPSGTSSRSRKAGGSVSRTNRQRSNEKVKGKNPLRPRNSADGPACDNDAEKQRNDEQWALLKSMRRRQEAALRDAEQERETVQQWAASERESVKKWADDQRKLIRREKHRASTTAMASQRERQKDERRQQDAFAELKKSSKAEIDKLQSIVEKLRTEMEGTKAKYRMTERKLREKLRVQSEMIQQLQEAQAVSTPDPSSTAAAAAATVGRKPSREKKASSGTRSASTASPRTSTGTSRTKEAPKDDDSVSKQDQKNDGEGRSCNSVVTWTNNSSQDGEVKMISDDTAFNGTMGAEKRPGSEQGGDGTIHEHTTSSQPHIVLEESTEQWVKRLEERHNTLPITTTHPTQVAAVTNSSITTPALSKSDDLIAKANQLLSGSNSRQKRLDHLHRHSANEPVASAFSDIAYPIAQHTPDPQQTSSILVEGDGSEARRIVSYRNGTSKQILPDGTTKVYFANGDVKTSCPNQKLTIYYYAAAQTTHTTHAEDGLEVFEFSNGQTEKHFRDGRKEVFFADGTVKIIDANGTVTTFPDGVKIVEASDGTKQIYRE